MQTPFMAIPASLEAEETFTDEMRVKASGLLAILSDGIEIEVVSDNIKLLVKVPAIK